MAIGVFCGSRSGNDEIYTDGVRHVGETLARSGIEVIYGGARVGLMGVLADAVLANDGRITGVIPSALVGREIAHTGLTELRVVESMHHRKTVMSELSSGFIALPGGAGTFEEIFEQWTWAQLGIHEKPCGFLNIGGYFDPVRAMIEKMAYNGFISEGHANMLQFSEKIETLISAFKEYVPPVAKWIDQNLCVNMDQ